jgi:hypothetical protein
MCLLVLVVMCCTSARGDVSLRRTGIEPGRNGFTDGSGRVGLVAVSPSRGWLAVIDQIDSCCSGSTLVLLVLTERGKEVAAIPFGCDGGECPGPRPDRPRAHSFLQRHGFVLSSDAAAFEGDDSGAARTFSAGRSTVTLAFEELRIEGPGKRKRIPARTSFVVYLPSKKLLLYRWYDPNIPDVPNETSHGPYSGVEIERLP